MLHTSVQRSRFNARKQWATFQIYCVQFGPESPILQALWEQAMSQWAQWARSCRFRPDNNKVLFHHDNFTIWLCHCEPKFCWRKTEFGNIDSIMPIVSRMVFIVLGKISYWGRVRDSKYKMFPNIYEHFCRYRCTDACGISDLYRRIYCQYYWWFFFTKSYILSFCRLWSKSTSKIERLLIVFGQFIPQFATHIHKLSPLYAVQGYISPYLTKIYG